MQERINEKKAMAWGGIAGEEAEELCWAWEGTAKLLIPLPAALSVSGCCWIVTFPKGPWRPVAVD